MNISASAPGKLMLLGEHAVVYHHPCLVTAVDIRVRVTIEEISGDEILIQTPKMRETNQYYPISWSNLRDIKEYDKDTAFVTAALQKVLVDHNIRKGLRINTYGPINSFGLGSSSAVTIATIFALAHLLDLQFDKRQLFEWAYSAVLAVQKEGSGFDIASAIYGGTLYFKTAGEIMDPLQVDELPILIGYSGKKVSTTNYIEMVKQLRSRHDALITEIFEMIEKIVLVAREQLLYRNWSVLGELMNINQGLLESLGVNTLSLAKPIYAARDAGAYGAKLSGAGGGDCMFALVSKENREQIKQAMITAGAEIVTASPNAVGVRLDS